VGKSIKSIQVYLKKNGLETAPNKSQPCSFNKKKYKKRDSLWRAENHVKKMKGFFGQINYVFKDAFKI
jgi:hypothetical protein